MVSLREEVDGARWERLYDAYMDGVWHGSVVLVLVPILAALALCLLPLWLVGYALRRLQR